MTDRQREAKRREASKRCRDDKRREVKVKGDKAARSLSALFPLSFQSHDPLGNKREAWRDGTEGGKRRDQIIRQGGEGPQHGTVHGRGEEENNHASKVSDLELTYCTLICTSSSHVEQDFKNLILKIQLYDSGE